jgi:hypothetical protein
VGRRPAKPVSAWSCEDAIVVPWLPTLAFVSLLAGARSRRPVLCWFLNFDPPIRTTRVDCGNHNPTPRTGVPKRHGRASKVTYGCLRKIGKFASRRAASIKRPLSLNRPPSRLPGRAAMAV